jgi:hypothetical protein
MPEWTKPASSSISAVLKSMRDAKIAASIVTIGNDQPPFRGLVLGVSQDSVQIALDTESIPTYIALAHIVAVTPTSLSTDPIVVLPAPKAASAPAY